MLYLAMSAGSSCSLSGARFFWPIATMKPVRPCTRDTDKRHKINTKVTTTAANLCIVFNFSRDDYEVARGRCQHPLAIRGHVHTIHRICLGTLLTAHIKQGEEA